MSLEKAFLADVAEHPDDDAPRLVYADWLQDNGDPDRAEFIRVQVELARRRLTGGAERRKELKKRQKALFGEHGKRWASALGKWCGADLVYWRRGFPDAANVSGDLTAVAAELPGILTAPITNLNVTLMSVRRGEGKALAAHSGLARLRRLWMYSSGATLDRAPGAAPCEREMAALLRSEHLTNLASLSAIQLCVGESGLKALIELPRLHELHLYASGVGEEPARAICGSPLAARLTELRLADGSGVSNAEAIADTPAMSNLRVLELQQQGVDDQGARRLAEAAHLAGLHELGLYYGDVGSPGAAALAKSPHFTKLRLLDLSRNAVGPAGVRALIASTTLPRGLHLDLWDNHATDYTPALRAALEQRYRKVNFSRSK